MSYLYRHGLLISRKQPYIDWANGIVEDGAALTYEVSNSHRSLFLVPEVDHEPELEELVGEYWPDIFENELAMWMVGEKTWPEPRTREMFDAWFDVELNESVYDLTPEEPLTQSDVEAAQLDQMMNWCAGCGLEIDEDKVRSVGFKLHDRSAYQVFEGRVLPLLMKGADDDEAILTLVTAADSPAAQRGDDLIVRVCSSQCEKVVRSIVPKALKRWEKRMRHAVEGEPGEN